MSFGMTDKGFNPKRANDILKDITERIRDIEDDATGTKPFVNESDDSIVMQMASIFSVELASCWEAAYMASTQFDPLTAYGVMLKGLVQLNGIEAKFGSPTILKMIFSGTPLTTIPSGSLISDIEGKITVETRQSYSIGEDGQVEASAYNIQDGEVEIENNTIISIKTPIQGWSGATNAETISVGTNEETDEELRIRQEQSTAETSYTNVEAIYAGIKDVDGVTFARVYNNTSQETDSRGIPGKSIAAVVVGGDNEEIADVIFKKSPALPEFFGNVSVTFVDDQGIPNVVSFSRPEDVPISIKVEIRVVDGSVFPPDGFDQIKNALINYSKDGVSAQEPGFTPGSSIIRTRLYTPINTIPGFETSLLHISKKGEEPLEQDVEIKWNEVATLDIDDIVVEASNEF